MMYRYSSRRQKLFTELLNERLGGAQKYDRIAGYFSSSILDIAGEAIEKMSGKVRIICNSELDIDDVRTAQLTNQNQKQEWCDFKPEELPPDQDRFRRLYDFLKTGKLEVRVLPKKRFGLAHGKAGIITMKDGSQTTFLGSVNESVNGWLQNYELVWEDDSREACEWVQEEFDALWNDDYAKPLSDLVLKDIERLSTRKQFATVEDWAHSDGDAASAIIESPIYRKSFGLWDHQKFFIKKAFQLHKTIGARLINADQVGLGKTCQLAESAMLMSLWDGKPVLAIVPKTLLKQWRDDMHDLMGIPSAYWNGRGWIDEEDHFYGLPVDKCPRRIGIISQGVIVNNKGTRSQEIRDALLAKSYSCVIVDECHRARRQNLAPDNNNRAPQKNRLYNYLCDISKRTRSMLLATATPVQMNPVEAWDLLNILAQGSDGVMGTSGSKWRKIPIIQEGLDIITGKTDMHDTYEMWEWMRNPLPQAIEEPQLFGFLRQTFEMDDDDFVSNMSFMEMSMPARMKLNNEAVTGTALRRYNPYIDHIVRRSRNDLENKINPMTGVPYLQKIDVVLYGESDKESIPLMGYLKDAYELATEFCRLIQKRCKAAGLFKTLLLRRIGSSIVAGYKTGRGMLDGWNLPDDDEDDEDEEQVSDDLKTLTKEESEVLRRFVGTLEASLNNGQISDPKLQKIIEILDRGVRTANGVPSGPWKDKGCILFSQYLDTASFVAEKLSEHYPSESVGLYAGGTSSRIYENGVATPTDKDKLKEKVKKHEVRILIGTDAASEGLNLQTLGALINIDLPWNPTRLEQRKGRIQRIGQVNPSVHIFNMKYSDSVEERVHDLLSGRLQDIYDMFGQIPDVLEDVWIDVANGEIEAARERIRSIPSTNPFELKYNADIDGVDWESCSDILSQNDVMRTISKGWEE